MDFKKNWIKSKQPRKQRKYRATVPLHIKHRFMSVHLSKELKEKHKKRSIEVRKGDKVKILRGDFKGKIGSIEKVDIKKEKVFIMGIEVIKKDGTKKPQAITPSNLLITSLNLEDKKRQKSLERKND